MRDNHQKKKKKPMSRGFIAVIIVILVAAVGILGFSLYKLVGIGESYKEANDLYDSVASQMIEEETSAAETEKETSVRYPIGPMLPGTENQDWADREHDSDSLAPTDQGQENAQQETEERQTEKQMEDLTTVQETEEPQDQTSVQEPAVEQDQTEEQTTGPAQRRFPISEFYPGNKEMLSDGSIVPGGTTESASDENISSDLSARLRWKMFADYSRALLTVPGPEPSVRFWLPVYETSESRNYLLRIFSKVGIASIPYNYEALKEKYPDAVGWIYQKDTMSYPIVQAEDNDKYLRHMINGEYNVAGSLFVDYIFKQGLNSRYSIVYGHNMDDKSMFGTLTDYNEESYYREHPVFELYSGDRMYRCHVYAAFQTEVESELFTAPDQMTDQEFIDLMKWVDEQKLYKTEAPAITKDSVVTVLATCIDYPRNYDYRYIVVLVRECPLRKGR